LKIKTHRNYLLLKWNAIGSASFRGHCPAGDSTARACLGRELPTAAPCRAGRSAMALFSVDWFSVDSECWGHGTLWATDQRSIDSTDTHLSTNIDKQFHQFYNQTCDAWVCSVQGLWCVNDDVTPGLDWHRWMLQKMPIRSTTQWNQLLGALGSWVQFS